MVALKRFFRRHERTLVPLMLVVGVVVDVVTFRAVELTTAFALLGVYTVLVGSMILFIHSHDARHGLLEHLSFAAWVRVVAPFVVQFAFGALLSAALIFYWFSGSFAVSWPLFVLFIALMAGNDVLREHYLRPGVQLAVWYFVLFAMLAVALPSLLGSISPWVFGLAGVASLLVMVGYLRLLFRVRPDLKLLRPSPVLSVAIIFLAMNAAYALNIIPPIPLSLVDAGVYHLVERRGDDYLLVTPESSWMERLLPGESIVAASGQRVYVYASIFAPVDLDTTIVHHWSRLTDEGWVSVNRLSYRIVGGRRDGYRGYSYLTNHVPGTWRVDVETLRGQVIGRVGFEIVERSF